MTTHMVCRSSVTAAAGLNKGVLYICRSVFLYLFSVCWHHLKHLKRFIYIESSFSAVTSLLIPL